jgi:hypothetical protein
MMQDQKKLHFTRDSTGLVRRGFMLFRGILREIFDESAYARFLDEHALVSSRQAYAAFLREGQGSRERRPRCC